MTTNLHPDLEAFQVITTASPAREAANHHALRARLDAGETGPEIADVAAGSARALKLSLFGGAGVAILAAAWLGVGDPRPVPGASDATKFAPSDALSPERGVTPAGQVGAVVDVEPPEVRVDSDATTPTPQPVDDPSDAQRPPAVPEAPGSEARPARRPGAGSARKAALRTAAPVPQKTAAPDASSLAAEVALLRRGKSALASGAAKDAATHAREYLRRFPAGSLREEARLLLGQALCAQGQQEQARAAVASLARLRSPVGHSARKLCAGVPQRSEKKAAQRDD